MRLDSAQQSLVLANLRLARKIARSYEQAYPGGDWRSVAYLGLAEAAGRYDSSRETAFGLFARRRIAGALRSAWESDQRYRRSQLDRLLLRAARCSLKTVEDGDTVDRLLRPLAPRNRAVVRLAVIEGWSQADVARHLGCSPSLVRKRLKRGLTQIRALYNAGAVK